MGVATGCGCKEVYRFPHTNYPYFSCICSFLQQHSYFLFIKKNVFTAPIITISLEAINHTISAYIMLTYSISTYTVLMRSVNWVRKLTIIMVLSKYCKIIMIHLHMAHLWQGITYNIYSYKTQICDIKRLHAYVA